MEEVALWAIALFVAAVFTVILTVAYVERRQRKKIEALGRRRKDRIQL